MFTRIPGNLLEDSGECYYFKIPRNVKEVPGNVQEDSGECSIRFWGMFKKIQGNVQEDSRECSKRFREMCKEIPGNVRKNFGECLRRFWGMLEKIPGNLTLDLFCEVSFIFHQILQLTCDRRKECFLRYYLLLITNLLRLNTVFLPPFFPFSFLCLVEERV